jgi:hypothetical protein
MTNFELPTDERELNRQAAILGLRQLADYLTAHPEVPMGKHQLNEFVDTREEWDEIRDKNPELTAKVVGEYVVLRKIFGGVIELDVNADRPEPLEDDDAGFVDEHGL